MFELKVEPDDFLILKDGKSCFTIENPTNKYVFYKVRLTAPNFYSITPSSGMIGPHGQIEVEIEVNSSIQANYNVCRKHKFQIAGAIGTNSWMPVDEFWTDETFKSAWKKVLKFGKINNEVLDTGIFTDAQNSTDSLNTVKSSAASVNETQEGSGSKKRAARKPKVQKTAVRTNQPARSNVASQPVYRFNFSIVTLVLVSIAALLLGIIIGSII